MRSSSWTIEGATIKVPNGKCLTFDFEIKEAVQSGDVLVVILNVPPDKVLTENVFGVSTDGELLWQIERIAATATCSANRYVGVIKTDNEFVVRIPNWGGE